MRDINGFTLIELMVTIAVVVVLLAMGVPALQQYATGNRLVAELNTLSGDLTLARSEAIKRGTQAAVCASSNSTTATPVCNTTEWENGWIAFADLDNDGVFNNDDVLIAVAEPLPTGMTLRPSQFDDQPGKVRFRSSGALVDVDGDGDTDGTLIICDPDGESVKARALNINNLGRVTVATDTDTNDVVNDVSGADVTCP